MRFLLLIVNNVLYARPLDLVLLIVIVKREDESWDAERTVFLCSLLPTIRLFSRHRVLYRITVATQPEVFTDFPHRLRISTPFRKASDP